MNSKSRTMILHCTRERLLRSWRQSAASKPGGCAHVAAGQRRHVRRLLLLRGELWEEARERSSSAPRRQWAHLVSSFERSASHTGWERYDIYTLYIIFRMRLCKGKLVTLLHKSRSKACLVFNTHQSINGNWTNSVKLIS